MNIPEPGDIYLSPNIQTGTSPRIRATVNNDSDAEADSTSTRVDAYTPEQSETAAVDGQEVRDEYIPGPTVIGHALYNVSDVKDENSDWVITTSEPMMARLEYEEESDKITDIMLSMGKKLLSIFRVTA